MREELIWKKVLGYDLDYEVNQYSDVRVITPTSNGLGFKYLGKRLNKGGYFDVFLLLNGKRKGNRVHRLSAMAFIPNPENKPCVNHKDCNRLNNHVSNLEWVTHKENSEHAVIMGRYKSQPDRMGINNPRYKHGDFTVKNKNKLCKSCNKEFLPKLGKQIYCSRSCGLTSRTGTTYNPRTVKCIRRKRVNGELIFIYNHST